MPSGTITPGFLSESTNGRGVLVSATSTPGTLVHTAVSSTASIDVVTIYASNNSGSTVLVTVEFGGTTDPDDLIETSVGANDSVKIIDRYRINNGLAIRVFDDGPTGTSVTIFGRVNTILL